MTHKDLIKSKYMQLVGGWTATAYALLGLQIVPTTTAHNDGRTPAMNTHVIMPINGCNAGGIISRLSAVSIYQIQHNCRCLAGGSDSSHNAERIGKNNFQKDDIFTMSIFWCTLKFLCVM